MATETLVPTSEAQQVTQILDTAEHVARQGGYFCFQLDDIAASAGLPSDVLRSHFEDKQALAVALLKRYITALIEALGPPDAPDPLKRILEVWGEAARTDDQMCLCVLYGSEILALPDEVATVTREYYSVVTEWIETAFDCEPDTGRPEAILAGLCGALVTVRAMNRPQSFEVVATQLIGSVLSSNAGE